MNTLPRLGLAVAVLMLSACAQRPVLRQPDPVVQPAALVPAQFPAGAAATTGPSIAGLDWSAYFADARLRELIGLALQHNRDLQAAGLNIQRAQAQYQIRSAAQLPTVNAAGTASVSGNTDTTIQKYQVGLATTAYELDLWGRVANLRDAALQNYYATQSAERAVQIALIGQIAQAFVTLAADQEQLRLAQQTHQVQQQLLTLNQKRLQVGIGSAVPVRQSELSVETARLAIGTYQTLIEQDKNLLRLLVGTDLPDTALPSRLPAQLASPATLSTGVPSDLLRNRPDLAQAEYSLSAAGANLAAARAAFYPTVTLGGQVGLSADRVGDLFKSGAFGFSIGPSISLPIFDHGARQANLQVSEVEQQLALTTYQKAIQTAFREVADVQATRQFLHDRLQAQRRLVSASEGNYQLSQARNRAGLDSNLSVLDAQRQLFNAQQGQISLQQAALLSEVNLYKALGGGAKAVSPTAPAAQAGSSGGATGSGEGSIPLSSQASATLPDRQAQLTVTTPAVGGVQAVAETPSR